MSKQKDEKSTVGKTIFSVFHFISAIFAIYLSFKCNFGFNFGGLLMACCCPYIYILYKLATADNFCYVFGNK